MLLAHSLCHPLMIRKDEGELHVFILIIKSNSGWGLSWNVLKKRPHHHHTDATGLLKPLLFYLLVKHANSRQHRRHTWLGLSPGIAPDKAQQTQQQIPTGASDSTNQWLWHIDYHSVTGLISFTGVRWDCSYMHRVVLTCQRHYQQYDSISGQLSYL